MLSIVVWIITSDILRTLCLNIQMFIISNLEFKLIIFSMGKYYLFLWYKLGFCYVRIYWLSVLIGVYEMFGDKFFTGIFGESMKFIFV